MGRSRPHAPGSRLRAGGRAVGAHRPTQPGSAGNRTSAQACAARSALPAPPPWFVHRAPLHRPGPACGRFRGARRWPIQQPAPLRLPWPARAPRLAPWLAPSLVAPRAIARPSPAASSARVWRHGSLRHSSPGPRGSRFCCIFSRSVLQTFVRCGTISMLHQIEPLVVSSTLWPFGAICFTGRCCHGTRHPAALPALRWQGRNPAHMADGIAVHAICHDCRASSPRILVCDTARATYLAARAWNYRNPDTWRNHP